MKPILHVLVTVDPQEDFVNGSLGTDEAPLIVPKIVKTINRYNHKDCIIIGTKDTHTDDYLKTQEGRNLPVIHTKVGTKGWQYVEPIETALRQSQATVYIIEKQDSFGSEALAAKIKQIAIENSDKQIVVTFVGYVTEICVITNALVVKTAVPEIEIRIVENCCGGITQEGHQAAITVAKACQVTIIREEEGISW